MEYVSPRDLADTLRQTPTADARRPLIIDVRDDDFAGGHIRGAVNLPQRNFEEDDDVDKLVETFKDKPVVVFHCMMSQVRGPFCARRFASRLDVVLKNADHKPEVKVLHGGFQQFARMYGNDPDLVEDMHTR
ncbi:TPA: hypothetical protein N0F65_005903 [Lagenidium giganteum]|uniref:protein-tyrosine-phosphatase n=1 Tax=Lagenidium giganteum TaxID=4803 RepID=A0AAV2Z696_9STRA|nr:TPA: hypothetical protein N0F65_005903 [Lagenidium giganteum]